MIETSITNKKMSRGAWAVVLASGITFIFYLVPFLNPITYPLALLSTMVHEMGHGLAAIFVGGSFESYKMWWDGSGIANIGGSFGSLAKAFIAAAGLVGPSIVAAIFFLNIKSERRSRIVLASFGIILFMSILLVVRNLFGAFFVGLVAAGCFFFSLGAGKTYCQLVLAFLAMQLALSVFSRSDYLFVEHAVTKTGLMPSDVSQIAEALILPYWFWGAICGLFSLLVLIFGIKRIFR